jgi:hypothetical protein
MNVRRGNIIYLAACALALVWAGYTLIAETGGGDQIRWGAWVFGGLLESVVILIAGWVIKYALAHSEQ